MSQPLFTVATITYNSSKWVRQAIESVLASSYTDFEYLISDDCSTDDTWEIIKQYDDPRIRSWQNESNIGEYPNRNMVLNKANGRYIYYIDGDDFIYKETLKKMSFYITSFPACKGIWGIHNAHNLSLPMLLSPKQLTELNFLSLFGIANVGLAETVLSVFELKNIGGFDTRFAIGDNFIKKLFSLYFSVLLVEYGNVFWRQRPDQATRLAEKGLRNFIDMYRIDKEILFDLKSPLTFQQLEVAKLNFKIRTIKLLFKNTIGRGSVFKFFNLMRVLSISFFDIRFLFIKGIYKFGYNDIMNASN